TLDLGRFCRLCYGESDGLPGLVVDSYGDVLSVEILTAGMERLKSDIEAALQALLSPKGIVYRNDSDFRTLEGLTNLDAVTGTVPETVELEENGIKYLASPRSGQKTGFYYDQRENRRFLMPYFEGCKVLDLHCFTGGFALAAAKAGAEKAWGVDTSAQALELAKAAAEKNGFSNVMFNKMDAEEMLYAAVNGELPENPDFILLDPPPLARSKKHLTHARKLYAKLNMLALRALPQGGYLATSSCSHHVSRALFEEILREALRKSGRQAFVLETRGQSKDHPVLAGMPETAYLNFMLLKVI
ncbi:MAG TPA: methyltransferase domain-containing protein, partial [Elusimicrobiales bacterium]|nr:methyltransferase domain-containing protein [Elusimicrobiales bacterium]